MKTWQDWAKALDGMLYKTDDGIEVQLEIPANVHGYMATINGHPTANGKCTKAYQDKRREYCDDWSYCWQGEAPASLYALVQ